VNYKAGDGYSSADSLTHLIIFSTYFSFLFINIKINEYFEIGFVMVLSFFILVLFCYVCLFLEPQTSKNEQLEITVDSIK